MEKTYLKIALLVVVVSVLLVSTAHATAVYPFDIFTNNGSYYNSPAIDLYVEVSDGGDYIDFTFCNESLVESSIARIYFDDDSLLDTSAITEGAGTSFSQHATPRNLPSGKSLEPPFVATEGFSFNGQAPRPQSGVNPGEWLRITFDINGSTFAAVINGLDTGAIRIGTHIIALPDGSSESAIAVPEPATIALLGLGGLALIRRKR